MFDETSNIAVQKTASGSIVFIYPLSIKLTYLESSNVLSAVKSLQYDGRYFWTLQSITSTSEPVIRQWLFNNYECKLQQEFILYNTSTQTYNANSFAIEHYKTKLLYPISEGTLILNTEEYYDSTITSGTILSIGPNGYDYCEDVVVNEVVGSDIILTSGTQYSYDVDAQVILSKSILLFNEYYGTTSTSGSLIRFDSHSGDFLSSDPNTDYKSVIAATFARVQGMLRDNEQDVYDTIDDAYTLIYVKSTNAKFRNLSDLLSTQPANSVNYSFTGVSGSLPNTTMWNITSGDPMLYDDALLMSTSINGHDEIKSNYVLMNDFDVQISGSLSNGFAIIDQANSTFRHFMNSTINNTSYEIGVMYNHADASTISGCSVEYTMDSVSGTILYDTSGYGHSATTSEVTYTYGKIGNALVITDKTDYIKLNTSVSGSIVSVSMWYYFDGTGNNYNTLIGRDGPTYQHLLVSGTSNLIGFWNNGWYSSGATLTSGSWHHLALIKNGTNSKLYLNNTLVQNSNSSFNNATYPMSTLGNYISISGTQGSLGKLDCVRIYDGIGLTDSDINTLYMEGYYGTNIDHPLVYTTVSGAVSTIDAFTTNINDTKILYTMDSVSGTIIYDDIGSNYATNSGITYASGVINNAAVITSKSDYIELSQPINSSNASISMWYYFDGFGGTTNTLLGNDELGIMPLYVSSSTNYLSVYNHIGYESSGPALISGTWYHIVLVKNGTNSKIYLDKDLIHDIDTASDNAMYPIQTIGNKKQRYFSGTSVDQVPTMTSNTAPSGIAAASSVYSAYYAYKAMDNSTSTANRWQSAVGTTGWLSYTFITPTIVNRYTMSGYTTSTYSPNTWIFEGWNGSYWELLDSKSGITWTASEKKTYDINNSTAFITYRITITANNGGAYVIIQEWELINTGVSTDNLTRGSIGKFDQIRIFDREITVDEIEELYDERYYGIAIPSDDYMLRLVRDSGVLYYYYKNIISEVDTGWTLIGSNPTGIYDGNISLGLYSDGITVSGAIFDDLTYNSGYVKYPISEIPYYGIMTMDNLKVDNTTVIPIYALSYYDGTLYRLQISANYYGTNYTWSTYNYVVSTAKSFMDSMTVTAYPTILPADGRNVSEITCIVLDQYGNGKINSPVTFTDDDDYGYITINPQNTDYYYGNGESVTYYKAGVDIHSVTITVTATQYD